jgi:large subunit ribosomal protein L21
MKYTILALDGRQFYLEEGTFFNISYIPYKIGTFLLFNKALIIKNLNTFYIGKPYIISSFIKILGEVIGSLKLAILIIFKMRSKKKYRHNRGYKHKLTKLVLNFITL